jgi:hypothetical protein
LEEKQYQTLIINDDLTVEGWFTFELSSKNIKDVYSSTGYRQKLEIEGKLVCNTYIHDITSIEGARYKLLNVDVHTEGFISDSDSIDYIFTAQRMEVKY